TDPIQRRARGRHDAHPRGVAERVSSWLYLPRATHRDEAALSSRGGCICKDRRVLEERPRRKAYPQSSRVVRKLERVGGGGAPRPHEPPASRGLPSGAYGAHGDSQPHRLDGGAFRHRKIRAPHAAGPRRAPRLLAHLEIEPALRGAEREAHAKKSSGERCKRSRRLAPRLLAAPPSRGHGWRRLPGQKHDAPCDHGARKVARPDPE